MNTRALVFIVSCIAVAAPTLVAHAVVEGFIPLVPETPFIAYGEATSFVGLLQALIGVSVGIASVLAVVMVAIGGFQYMTTDSVFALGNAREKIKDAIVGLLIVLLSVLVLRTINPKLVSLDIFQGANDAPATPAPVGPPRTPTPPGPSPQQTACLTQCKESNDTFNSCWRNCKMDSSNTDDDCRGICGSIKDCNAVCPSGPTPPSNPPSAPTTPTAPTAPTTPINDPPALPNMP